MTNATQRLLREDIEHIAYVKHDGDGPGVVFFGGFRSDMTGTKAMALDAWAQSAKRAFLRFDYFGHGQSGGAWADATISRWRDDSLAVLDQLSEGPQVLVGSSMGGWMALLAALARPDRVKALVLIAPAADFTEALMWEQFPLHVREAIQTEGVWHAPSAYGEPYPITNRLIEDGRTWSILHQTIPITCPVHILQGYADPDVPWTHAMRTVDALESQDVTVTLTKAGDHRLSSDEDLARMLAAVDQVS